MLLNPIIELTIANTRLKSCINCTIERKTSEIGSIASIVIPINVIFNNQGVLSNLKSLSSYYKSGDKVKIRLGNNAYKTEFEGFISKIDETNPLVINCMDYSWLFTKFSLTKTFESISIVDFINWVLSEVNQRSKTDITLIKESDFPQITLQNYIVKNATPMQILAKLKENYCLTIYLTIDNKLYCGLLYQRNGGKVIYDLDALPEASSLEFQNSDDVKYKVKAISFKSNMKKIEVETGDPEGDTRTLNFYGIESEAELKKMAESEIKKYKFTGYRGSFTGFVIPYVEPGMIAEIRDTKYPGREGTYYVDSVKTEYVESGCKRNIEISIKTSI